MTKKDAGYGTRAALLPTTVAIVVAGETTCELDSGSLSSRTIISRATTTRIAESCLRLDGKLFSRFIIKVYFRPVGSDCDVNNAVECDLKWTFCGY